MGRCVAPRRSGQCCFLGRPYPHWRSLVHLCLAVLHEIRPVGWEKDGLLGWTTSPNSGTRWRVRTQSPAQDDAMSATLSGYDLSLGCPRHRQAMGCRRVLCVGGEQLWVPVLSSGFLSANPLRANSVPITGFDRRSLQLATGFPSCNYLGDAACT